MSRYQHIYMVGDKVDLAVLRRCMWDNGCHKKVRYSVWKMALGYLPEWTYLHEPVMEVRRNAYRDAVRSMPSLTAGDQEEESQSVRQLIRSGLSNTALKIPLFRSAKLTKMLERVIQMWLLDNSEQPYVDMLSRIPIPITYAFLDEYGDPETMNVDSQLSDALVFQLEVDVYNCMSLLLAGDTRDILSGNPSKLLERLAEIVKAVDPQLAEHLANNVSYADFALQWIDTLLIDQLQKISLSVFLWDRYFASGKFVDYHLAACAFLLVRFEAAIKKLRQQDLLVYLQSLPIHQWDYAHMESLIDRIQDSPASGLQAPPHLDYAELKAHAYHRAKLGLTGNYSIARKQMTGTKENLAASSAPSTASHPHAAAPANSAAAATGNPSSSGDNTTHNILGATSAPGALSSAISQALSSSGSSNGSPAVARAVSPPSSAKVPK